MSKFRKSQRSTQRLKCHKIDCEQKQQQQQQNVKKGEVSQQNNMFPVHSIQFNLFFFSVVKLHQITHKTNTKLIFARSN